MKRGLLPEQAVQSSETSPDSTSVELVTETDHSGITTGQELQERLWHLAHQQSPGARQTPGQRLAEPRCAPEQHCYRARQDTMTELSADGWPDTKSAGRDRRLHPWLRLSLSPKEVDSRSGWP